MGSKSQFDKWETRNRYYDKTGRPLPNTLGLCAGKSVWLRTSFGKIVLEQVDRVTSQFAWCGSSIKIRLSNGLTEWKKYHWHGRAFTTLESAEAGEMPMTLRQFQLLVARGEDPSVLYSQSISWACERLEQLWDTPTNWKLLNGVVV